MKIRGYVAVALAALLGVSFAEELRQVNVWPQLTEVLSAAAPKPKKAKKRKRPKKRKTSETELDPLRPIKLFKGKKASEQIGPNVIIAIDRSPRMLYDYADTYYDPKLYDKQAAYDSKKEANPGDVANDLGVAAGSRYYYRKYVNLRRKVKSSGKSGQTDEFEATTIEAVDETEADFAEFDLTSRLGMARDGLAQAIEENLWTVRFGVVGMRQGDDTNWPTGSGNADPVTLKDNSQKDLKGDFGNKEWKVTFPTTTSENIAAKAEGSDVLVKADDKDSSAKALQIMESSPDQAKGIKPFGLDDDDFLDSPVANLLTDTKKEVERVMDVDKDFVGCRNTAVILVVGGGEPKKSNNDPVKVAAEFLSVTAKGTTRRVPIYVIGVGPDPAEVKQLQDIAWASGGDYIEAYDANTVAQAANRVVQAVHGRASEFDSGLTSGYQTVSPVVGTVDLSNARDINGNTLPNTVVKNGGSTIEQHSNVVITSGFKIPGFEADVRAFRVFKPVQDGSAPNGYKFVKDGTPLWVAHVPGASKTGSPNGGGSGGSGGQSDGKSGGKSDGKSDGTAGGSGGPGTTGPFNSNPGKPEDRNIYTFIPGTGMVAFTTANVATLKSYLYPDVDPADPDLETTVTELIDYVRAQPLGAVLSSTPALMNPPSMTPQPDADYGTFASARAGRRSLLFFGGNNGMLHAIDARLGVEVWAYIPFNLLPKLRTVVDGQGVEYFEYFMDGSPKIADIKVGNDWRTYLFVGQGAGGTFYQAFDVSDAGNSVASDVDVESTVVTAFGSPSVIPLAWSFPDYAHFDHALSTDAAPYGDLGGAATSVEKTVGETWATPLVAQLGDASGKWAAIVGSGYLSAEIEKLPVRNNTKAGHSLYALDAATGGVLSWKDVGDDANKKNLKNSLTADPAGVGSSEDSRFVQTVYVGDTEGMMWRFDVSSAGQLNNPVKVYDAAKEHPIFTPAAVVPAGGGQNYVFFATGIQTLPWIKKIEKFVLVGVFDKGNGAQCFKKDKSCEKFEVTLQKADGKGGDERVTGAPVVANQTVFWSTTTDVNDEPCSPPEASLFALTFLGGPVYDSNNDNKVDDKDKLVIKEPLGRATAPFVADEHLYFGVDNDLEIFGDPEDFNNGVGSVAARLLSWREIR